MLSLGSTSPTMLNPSLNTAANGASTSFAPSLPGQQFSLPHDWLPATAAPASTDGFSMQNFGHEPMFSNIPMASSSSSGAGSHPQQTSQPQSPQLDSLYQYMNYDLSPRQSMASAPSTGFHFSGSEIPFSGFDFLQNFASPMGGATAGPGASMAGAGSAGFGAGDVAAWQNFVETGIFNDVPEQPFALADAGAGGVVLEDEAAPTE